MKSKDDLVLHDDWSVLVSFLPYGWKEKAKELGALRRCRRFADAEPLLRTLLIHLADGCSLRETAVRAEEGGIAAVSDVALLKRLKAAGEWMRWMACGLMDRWSGKPPSAVLNNRLRIRLIDGSLVQEPGSTGSSWRVHYSIQLPSLQCDEVHVEGPKTGESFKRFAVQEGDLLVADRGFAHHEGIAHVLNGGGDLLVRLSLTSLILEGEDGKAFPLLANLRSLSGTRIGDWDVWLRKGESVIAGRVCAIKKSREAAERARRHTYRDSNRKGHTVRPQTLESAEYTFVFTTVDRGRLKAADILELYRGRWQIEMAFKRLKSSIAIGHLKKTDLEAAKALIHGKLLVAFLIEALLTAAEKFSPWGYHIGEETQENQIPVEGNVLDASPG